MSITQCALDLGIPDFNYACLIDFEALLANSVHIVSTYCFEISLRASPKDFSTLPVARILSPQAFNILPEGGALRNSLLVFLCVTITD
ncbi:hypothetical protein NPIL_670201 [Nephila pilipes]|uniref:Uncharacterized protein n=1 Tax=Nephila pilipes TaxID=299642 RepID=A0A8X6PI86_NEPPI|nr:hypothetical protein NPIL_670201 [Nephila pilipes]